MKMVDPRWQVSPNFKSKTNPSGGEFPDGLVTGFDEVLLLIIALAS